MNATLNAVNAALREIAQDPITTLEGQISVDAAKTLAILEAESERIQAQGWYFNTDNNVTLTPTVSGEIFIPSNYLNVDAGSAYIQRGNRLYDKENKTYVFNLSLEATVIRLFGYEELPKQVQLYVRASMIHRFQRSALGDETQAAYLQREALQAQLDFVNWDNTQGDYNMGVRF
jgi:hypothetical protein